MLTSNININESQVIKKPPALLKKKGKQNKTKQRNWLCYICTVEEKRRNKTNQKNWLCYLQWAFRIIIFEMSLAKLRKISYTRSQRNQIPQRKSTHVTKPSKRNSLIFSIQIKLQYKKDSNYMHHCLQHDTHYKINIIGCSLNELKKIHECLLP